MLNGDREVATVVVEKLERESQSERERGILVVALRRTHNLASHKRRAHCVCVCLLLVLFPSRNPLRRRHRRHQYLVWIGAANRCPAPLPLAGRPTSFAQSRRRASRERFNSSGRRRQARERRRKRESNFIYRSELFCVRRRASVAASEHIRTEQEISSPDLKRKLKLSKH